MYITQATIPLVKWLLACNHYRMATETSTRGRARAIPAAPGRRPELRETAARLGAFLRHIFIFSGAEHLRAIEDSGLTLTQCKALILLAGPEGDEPYAGRDIAERLKVSLPSVSRAVDGLVRSRLVSRVEDEEDRRVRRLTITDKGRRLAGEIVAARMADLEAFAAGLTPAQRRKLDAALEALLDREEIRAAAKGLEGVKE
jgi:DNA-binding MarR family transcriptional regulator